MIINPDKNKIHRSNGFVVLEGVNGAGKTTVKNFILEKLKSSGQQFVETFEPGDTNLGKTLRKILLEREIPIESSLAELFLFAADRSEHVESLIKRAIADKKIIICDRYYYSTTAFQGYGRGIDLQIINKINQTAIAGVVPDLVILLDLEAAEGLRRTSHRKPEDQSAKDAFEQEKLDFHNRIRQGFLKIAEESKENFVVIDAAKPLSEVLKEVDVILDMYIK